MPDELYCRECGAPMAVNQDGTTNHLLPSDSGHMDEVDYDRDADHVAILEEEEE
jgi:hypothetical protein